MTVRRDKARLRAKFAVKHRWSVAGSSKPPGFDLVRITDWLCEDCGTRVSSIHRPSLSLSPGCLSTLIFES